MSKSVLDTLMRMQADATFGAMPGITRLFQAIEDESQDFLDSIVATAKDHLDADIAFLAEFDGELKVIKRSAGPGWPSGVGRGSRLPLKETYCYRMNKGELPNIISDARNDERVSDLGITEQLNIGAYISVPVVMPDGDVFGSLCCIKAKSDPSIHERDVRFMRVLADLAGAQIGRKKRVNEDMRERIERIKAMIQDGEGLRMAFQPIVDLVTGNVVGAEALSRFDGEFREPPRRWFEYAWRVGLGTELEIAAVREAIAQMPELPEEIYLSFNASPETLQLEAFNEAISRVPGDRIVVEVTEHAAVEEYEPLIEAIERLRGRGIRLAVDDVGAGYSGLNHIVRVAPSILKLDMELTRDVDQDPVKQALAAATVVFGSRVGLDIVSEGIETAREAETLRELGIRYGQGFHFARPGPLPLKLSGGAFHR